MATPKRMANKQPESGRFAEFLAVLEAHTKLLAFFFGLCFAVIMLVLAVWFPKPTAFQYMVFRITLALAAAGVGGVIPGMIRLKFQPTTKLLIHAGGALALFVIVYFFAPADLKIQPDNGGIKQSNGVGNQAVMINNTGSGNVQVTAIANNPGLTKEQNEENNNKLADIIVAKMQHADASQRVLLEQQLKDVQARLADTEKSYEEKKQLLEKTKTALKQVKSQRPEAQIDNALADLQHGKTEAAEQTLDAVDDGSGRITALAAFRSGKLAEDRLDYEKAMRKYKRAVALEENNPEYLLFAGQMAYKTGEYNQAQTWLEHSLAIWEKEGKNDAQFSLALNELALIYEYHGNYAKAEPLYKRSLAIYEQNLSKDHPDIAASLNNLAALYVDQGRYEDAEPLYQRSLAIYEQKLGKDHPDMAVSLNNLAALYVGQGRYEDAEPLYQRSLDIWRKKLGKDHPHVATSLNNLASLYKVQGRYEEADPLFQQSLAVSEQKLGKDHPDVAISLNNLAALYEAQEKYAEAEPLYQRSLAITEKALGKDHPDVATSLNNLAGLYKEQGKYAEAEPLYQRSLAIREQNLGKNHPNVAQSLNNLAVLYEAQGKYAEVEPLHQRSLAIREQKLGKDHPDVAESLSNLAVFYDLQGKYSAAEPLYQRALAILKVKFPGGHPDIDLIKKNYDDMKREMAGL